jgi:hypothetical protein
MLLRWLVGYAGGTLAFQRQEHVQQAREIALGDDRHLAFRRIVHSAPLLFYHHPDPLLWRRILGAFRDLHRLTGGRDLTSLVAIFPEAYQIGRRDPDLTPQQRLLDACRQAGLQCLDLQTAFAAAGEGSFIDVQHPNARGFAAAGAAMAAALVGNDGQGSPSVTGEPPLLKDIQALGARRR